MTRKLPSLLCLQEAILHATTAVRMVPSLGRGHYEIAACQEALGDLETARHNLELAKRCEAPCPYLGTGPPVPRLPTEL